MHAATSHTSLAELTVEQLTKGHCITSVTVPNGVKMHLPAQAAGTAAKQNSLTHRSVGTAMSVTTAAAATPGTGANPPRPKPARHEFGSRTASESRSAARMANNAVTGSADDYDSQITADVARP